MKIPGQLIYQSFRKGLRSPTVRPWLLLGIFVYLLSPVDLIPSFLLGVGEVDDLLLVSLLVTELLQIWLGDPFKPPMSDAAAKPTIDIEASAETDQS